MLSEDARAIQQKATLRLVLATALLFFTGCVAATTVEVMQDNSTINQIVFTKSEKTSDPKKETRAPSPISPKKLLPTVIPEYNIKMHQLVPGQQKYAVESEYEYEKQSDYIPLGTYAKVSFWRVEAAALREIELRLKERYPLDNKVLSRGELKAHSGYAPNYSGFYLANYNERYLVEVHTNYRHAAPAERGTDLEDNSWKVFEEANKHLENLIRSEGDSN